MRHITINHTLQPNWDFFKPDELSISRQPAILANLCAASLTETKTLSNIFISSNKWPSKVRFSVTSSFLSFFLFIFLFLFLAENLLRDCIFQFNYHPKRITIKTDLCQPHFLPKNYPHSVSPCKPFFLVE